MSVTEMSGIGGQNYHMFVLGVVKFYGILNHTFNMFMP